MPELLTESEPGGYLGGVTGKLVSVLMPVNTDDRFVMAAVESVFRQTYPDWELLLGVSGHPKKSEPFCSLDGKVREWNSRDPHRIAVFDFPRCRNRAQTLNRLTELALGDYIALLDANSLWYEGKLDWQVGILDGGCDVVGTRAVLTGNRDSLFPIKTGEITHDDLLKGNRVVNSTVVMRRECAGWSNTDGFDDHQPWLELARAGKKIYVIREPLAALRGWDGPSL
jgi:glycosyltransferase involved in cell wall biosynthesis